VLDVIGVDPAGAQNFVLLLAEVVSDRTDDVDLVEERSGQRERGGDRVERDRAYDCHRHEAAKASVAAAA